MSRPWRILAAGALGLSAAPCAPGPTGPAALEAMGTAAGAAQAHATSPQAPASGGALAAPPPVRTGVTTHFSQGWPLRLMADAAALGTVTIRDSVHWAQVERVPGHYALTEANSGHVGRACAAGMTVLLGLEPRNPLYDGGKTAFSPAAQAAFARYVTALAARWPGCVVAIEIGNEINGEGGMTGPAATTRAASHTALLKAVYQEVKPAHPDLVLLGGSTNTIATGFLARLFAAGALAFVDGIAVHPYRADPEGVDWELARLRQAMRRAGRERPIWATEFSNDFADPAQAADWQLKMIALMESAGVANHFWYALADQPGFLTMGLVRFDGTRKPAARAYSFAARELAPLGPAVRVDHGDPTLFDFRFGSDTRVVWGAPRALEAPAGAMTFAADGSPIALPEQVSDRPVVLRRAGGLTFGSAQVLADSLYGFGAAPLSWFARNRSGALLPLAPVDWAWTSYLGNSAVPQFAANAAGIGTMAGTGTLVRYTAGPGPVAGATAASAAVCLRPVAPGMTAHAGLSQNGRTLWQAPVGPRGLVQTSLPVTLRPGDRIDLMLDPAGSAAPARFRYRLRISRGPGEAVSC